MKDNKDNAIEMFKEQELEIKSRNKSKLLAVLLLIVVAFSLGVFIGRLWESNSRLKSVSTNQFAKITPSLTPTPSPSSSQISLNISPSENWLKYEAKCVGLKQDITVYYPQSWKIGTRGEEDITDGGNDPTIHASECMIQFGYPFAPEGRQASYVDGLYGYIRIGSMLAPGTQLTDILNNYKKSAPYIKDTFITNIANREWVKYIYTDNSFWDTVNLKTLYKGRTYDIRYGVVDWHTIDASSSSHLFDIGEEFVNKLEFH